MKIGKLVSVILISIVEWGERRTHTHTHTHTRADH